MNYKALFKTAMLAGEIMAQSGAETFRVEDTMIRILKTSHLKSIDVFATTTGIVATLSDPSIEPITGVKRISARANNLSRINEVNQISRNICDDCISLEEAYDNLLNIREHKIYSNLIIAIATIISTGGSVGLFGGSIADCLAATFNGLMIVLISRFVRHRIDSVFMVDVIKSSCVSFLTVLGAYFFTQLNSDIIIIGSIMPLVPGIPITNAIRDTLQGNYMSGTARATEAFVISLGIALGVGFGMGLYNILERMLLL